MKLLAPLGLATTLVLLAGSACRPAAPAADAAAESTTSAGPPLEAPAELNLGRAIAGTRVSGELVIRATKPVRVLSVESSCECTAASAVGLPRELRAGETLALAIEVDLSKVGRGGLPKEGEVGPGRVQREIIVRSARGELRRPVIVEVSDSVVLEPAQIALPTMALGTTARASARVGPRGSGTSVAVLSAATTEPGLVVTTAPDGDGTLVQLEWTPAEAGRREALVRLGLDRPEDPSATLRLLANVVAPVTVHPTSIENLAAPITQPVVASLTVRRLDEEPLNLRSASTDNHRVQVKIEPGEGAQRIIRVLIPVMPAPAENSGTVTIQTGVPGAETLTVPFRVRAAPPA